MSHAVAAGQGEPSAWPVSPAGRVGLLLLLAAIYTGLNALKPLEIDDAAYEYYARQMAHRPLDPYGFALLWYDQPMPANEVLAPPVLPSSWALVRSAVGERPWAWKLGLLPWAVLLVAALHALLRRFCRGLELFGTTLIVLSPALLPSLNLMLDVPALALSLASLALFLRASDQASFTAAAWAGLLAGLAMQTKYTGFLAPGAMLLHAALTGRWLLGAGAALAASQVFVSWEFLIALLYGRSHFLVALPSDGAGLAARANLLPFLLSYLGGVAPPGILLALAALGVRRRWLVLAAGAALLGYALIALLDARFVSWTAPSALLFGPSSAPSPRVEFQLAELIFYLFGLAGAPVLILVVRQLWDGPEHRDTLFLLLWLGLETVGYLVLTPFPALRRILGVGVVLALLVLRLAARTCDTREGRHTLQVIGVGGVVLGLAFFLLDWRGAEVHRQAAEEAAHWVRAHGGTHAWYVGHWGFQFYAERQGLRPVVTAYRPSPGPIPLPPPSRLRRGDWLVVPDSRLEQQAFFLDPRKLEERGRLTIGATVPLRTVPCFYGGRVPLEHHEGSRLEVRIYRVLADFTPVSAEPAPSEARAESAWPSGKRALPVPFP